MVRPAVRLFSPSARLASVSTSTSASAPSGRRSFPAFFVRGGTSNGLVIREDVLPRPDPVLVCQGPLQARAAAWAPVLAPAMGSPDPRHGRQLDGLGSGVSSTSKVCVIAPAAPTAGEPARDVDFTFVQVGIRDGVLDLAGNCGNMISAVGPLAFDLGWGGEVELDGEGEGEGGSSASATVRIYNTNTRKLVRARFRVAGQPPRFCAAGDYAIDGVPGTHSRIELRFERPAGAKTGAADGLPTGRPVDDLLLPDGATAVAASLVDVANPGVFVRGDALGLPADDPVAAAAAIEAGAAAVVKGRGGGGDVDVGPLPAVLEHLRRAGAARMGLDPDTASVPKIVLLFPAAATATATAATDAPAAAAAATATAHIRCVALSMGQVHKAVPLTLALCLGAAARIPGTLAAGLVGAGAAADAGALTIGHPSGRVDVGTTLVADGTVLSADLHRTARVLMAGEVFY